MAPTMTLKTQLISKTTNFGKPYLEEFHLFYEPIIWGQMHNQVGYHPFKFQLDYYNYNRKLHFR